MLLGDALNFPLVAALGLFTLGPLTLLVTAIETLAFRQYLKTRFWSAFGRVLGANLLSTLAGGVVLPLQDLVVEFSGIHGSIPDFVRGYRWLAPLLVVVYFAKSILVEGFWLTRRPFLARIDRPAGRTFRAVLLGNLLSYLVVGPLFYFTTRPHFGGLDTTFDAHWTANPDLVVYYVDSADHFIKRMRLDGGQARTLVPYAARSILVSADESTVAYTGEDGTLFAYHMGAPEPIIIRKGQEPIFMTSVSLSPDHRRLAFLDPTDSGSMQGNAPEPIKVVNLDTRAVTTVGSVRAGTWGAPVSWSADGLSIYTAAEKSVYAFDANAADGPARLLTTNPTDSQLVENYVRAQGTPTMGGGRGAFIDLPTRGSNGRYSFKVYPFMGSHIAIEKDNRSFLFVQNRYGLLNASLPPIQGAVFLPSENELLVEWWKQLYVLGLETHKLGLVTTGENFVLRTPEFRVSLAPSKN